MKSKPICKVTFKLTPEEVNAAGKACLVGDFNDWDEQALEMNQLKDGSFKAVIDLEAGKSYQFRYLVDGARWVNDAEADAYVPAAIGYDQNCVVTV